MERSKLKIRDLTLRDGQQSLFATRLRQGEIDKLLPYYQNAGFYIMEVWGGAVPDSVMRYLDESPWTRLRTISKAMKGKSLLSALSRGRNLFGYAPYPTKVLKGFYEEADRSGLNVMRIFDALNDIDNVKESIKIINDLGMIADGAVCYTIDPKDEAAPAPAKKGLFGKLFGHKEEAPKQIFTVDYFVEKAKAMEALGAKMITLKDMAGLVTPARANEIIAALKKNLSVPVDFHTHCTPGYGLASSLMAILNGVDILDTNIWWFAEGSAAPAIELIYIFCKKMGVEIDVNMEAVGEIRKRLIDARRSLRDVDLHKDNFPNAFDPLNDKLPADVDALFDKALAAAQSRDFDTLIDACHAIEDYFGFPKPNLIVKNAEVPGGMYSNMVAQLKALGASDLLEDAMKLIPKVRRDAGLVPLVTPTSQIVGSQAVALALDRKKGKPDYSVPSMQFTALIRGEYGKTPVPIDPAFREKITGDATEHAYDVDSYKEPENPEYNGAPLAKNTEEVLLLELLPNVAPTFLKNRRNEEAPKPAEAPKVAEASKAAEAPKAAPAHTKPTGPTAKMEMPGKILDINVKVGDTVKAGQLLLTYEAMKMENQMEAERGGVVKQILVEPGQNVNVDEAVIEFE